MLKITYYYSACVGIRGPGASILCDPWFTPGAYDGAWHQYPRLENPVGTIGHYDWIYISHIHPDHYDPHFLRAYLSAYPRARLIIADFAHNHLARRMAADGFVFECVDEMGVDDAGAGTMRWKLIPNGSGVYDIDSALVVKAAGQAVVNLNDNPYSEPQITAIKAFLHDAEPRIALLPYAGAGPYPQTYFEPGPLLDEKAAAKKQQFFARYLQLRDAVSAKVNIPFAGQYLLGGRLSGLNPHRGVADAVEVRAFDPTAVVLADGGRANIDTESLAAGDQRREAYSTQELVAAAEALRDFPMRYEDWLAHLPLEAVPFKRLLPRAYAHARSRSACEQDYHFCLRVGAETFYCNANRHCDASGWTDDPARFPIRSEITLDHRHLFGLLTGLFHWDNAKVGSHLRVRRTPDRFVREAERFLDFFHL